MKLFHVKHTAPCWLALLLAAGAGGVFTLAFAPYHWHGAALIALPLLLLLILQAPTGRRAFWIGWLFGVGHHVTALGWIAQALLVDTERFAPLIPLAKLGIPAYLGLYTGGVAWLTVRSGFRGGAAVLLFAALWGGAEYARSYLLLPFAWNLTGYIWSDIPIISQGAALVGTPGLGVLTVLAAGGLALLLLRAPEARSWLLATAGLLALLVVYGTVRIVAATNNDYGITLRLIQPNIAQNLKWDARAAERHFERLLQLSRTPADKRLSAVIWPESAVAWPLDRDTARRMAAVSTLPEGAVLITGMNRWDFPEAGDAPPHPYNSLFVFDRSGAVRAAYDKHRLVPFGEYVPLRWLFNVDKVAGGAMTDFVPGAAGVKTVPAIAGLPSFSPLICYEAIYPGGVARRGKGRPQWLLNITNDAWFGLSAGPYQHLAMTRMRSIEEGLSLVRVANTGMTTVFDPWGRSLVRTALAEERVLDVPLQAAITPPLFARFGNAIPATLLGLCALVAVFSHLRSRHAEIIDPALSPVSR